MSLLKGVDALFELAVVGWEFGLVLSSVSSGVFLGWEGSVFLLFRWLGRVAP